jgi:hypothetical protein
VIPGLTGVIEEAGHSAAVFCCGACDVELGGDKGFAIKKVSLLKSNLERIATNGIVA